MGRGLIFLVVSFETLFVDVSLIFPIKPGKVALTALSIITLVAYQSDRLGLENKN